MSLRRLTWLPGTACVWTPLPDERFEAALHPVEAALVAGTAPRRRAHFAAGRACAHAALATLDADVTPLRRAAGGAPQWPETIAGSLSHCPEAAAAIVARTGDWAALGIDIEADRALPDDAAEYVLADAERAALAALPGGVARWALAAFAAKECVHKCVHPLRGAFLEFAEVAIRIAPSGDHGDASFVAEPLSDQARAAFAGLEWRGEVRRVDGLLFSLLAGC